MSGEDQAEARLRELLRDPRWSLPAGPDPEQRVRRAARRQRLRLAGLAGVAAAAAVIAVAVPAGVGVLGHTPRPEQPPAATTLYVATYNSNLHTHEGTVVPINTTTNTPGKFIHITGLLQIAITPDGKTVYAVHQAGTITPISTATDTPGQPIHVAGTYTQAIAITP